MSNIQDLFLYETDNSKIAGTLTGVVFPENKEQVSTLIKTAAKDIVPRGAGTNTVGATVPQNSLVICTKKMRKVYDFDAKKSTICAEPGVTSKELNEKLKAVGCEFPIYTNPQATLGGMIALNTLSSLGKYGKVSEHLWELEIVNGKGEKMQIEKTDLADIYGMEGTTGIITKAKIKVIPLQKKSISVFQSEDIEEIIAFARRLKSDPEVVALHFFSQAASIMMGLPQKNNLVIIFNSPRGKIKDDDYTMLEKKLEQGTLKLASDQSKEMEEAAFILGKLQDFLLFIQPYHLPFYGDFTSESIFIFFAKDDKVKFEILKVIDKLSGKPFLGYGLKRKNMIDPLRRKILQRVKKRYDPFLKLNKGKIADVTREELAAQTAKAPEENIVAEKGVTLDEQKNIIEKQLQDYRQTFQSEFSEEKVNQVEKISRQIPREIQRAQPPQNKSSDDLIRNIMFNKYEKKENTLINKKDEEDKKSP